MTWEWAKGLWNTILSLLPTSPFRQFIDNIPFIPYLPYVNWFLPLGECFALFSVWLMSYGLYLAYSIIMRWTKILGG